MRTVIRRVTSASASVDAENYRKEMGPGLLVLCAFEDGATKATSLGILKWS